MRLTGLCRFLHGRWVLDRRIKQVRTTSSLPLSLIIPRTYYNDSMS